MSFIIKNQNNYIKKLSDNYLINEDKMEQVYNFSLKHNLHIYDANILLEKFDYIENNINEDEIKKMTFQNKIERWINEEYKFKNIDLFLESRNNFLKNKRYTLEIPNKHPESAFIKFWKEEQRRCIYGYKVNDLWITGYYYFYLNYSPIEQTRTLIDEEELKKGKSVQSERIIDFPRFWDGDYFYFHYLEEAERNGLSAACLKTRGRGYSWKAASMANRNFYLIPKSKTIIYAGEDEYLVGGDGILTKCWSQQSFLDSSTAWSKKKQKKDTSSHKRASYIEIENGIEVEKGYMSEIMGKTLNKGASGSRGKRAKLIIFEEAGSFTNLIESWIVSGPSVAQDGAVFGLRIAFGTSGNSGEFDGLKRLFYNPTGFEVLHVNNIWSDNSLNVKVGWFQPDYINMQGYYDKNGNSLIKESREQILRNREKMAENGSDIEALLRMKAERPIIPEEAILKLTVSPFPRDLLKEQLIFLEKNKDIENNISKGKLIQTGMNNIEWEENSNTHIITTHNPSKLNREGGIEIYQHPIKGVKEQLYGYIIGVDPVDFDYNEINETKFSLGSCFVLNTITGIIAAEYTGRPDLADTFYENVKRLALYYNATVMYENNIKGLYTYFVNRNCEYLLADKPKILDDNNTFLQVGSRKYGYTAGEKTNKLGLQLIKAWLSQSVNGTEDLFILNTIKSKGLIDELIEWNPNGNFDRISALTAVLIFYKDIERMLDNGIIDIEKSEEAKFWKKPFIFNK